MNDTLQVIEYRRLVASIASHLSAEEVERITFIRDSGDGCRSDDGEPKTALHMLAALERRGEFSVQNIDGLIEIVKDVNRHDLVQLAETYKRTRHHTRKPGRLIRTPKLLRKRSSNSKSTKERTHLEETYELMVTRFTFLAQQMSLIPRLLEGEGDLHDEGTVILHSLKYAADELASKLTEAHEYFQELSSDGDWGLSSNSSSEDLRRGDSSEGRQTPQHQTSRTHGEEEVIYAQPCIPATRIPPSTQKQLLVRPPIAISCSKMSVESGYGREEEQDFTGDSGFSASTSKYSDDSDPYCVVDILWRRQQTTPRNRAPATDHGYMAVMTSNMNTDPVYDTVMTATKKSD